MKQSKVIVPSRKTLRLTNYSCWNNLEDKILAIPVTRAHIVLANYLKFTSSLNDCIKAMTLLGRDTLELVLSAELYLLIDKDVDLARQTLMNKAFVPGYQKGDFHLLIGILYYHVKERLDGFKLISEYLVKEWLLPPQAPRVIDPMLKKRLNLTNYPILSEIPDELLYLIFNPVTITKEFMKRYKFYSLNSTQIFNRLEWLGDAFLEMTLADYLITENNHSLSASIREKQLAVTNANFKTLLQNARVVPFIKRRTSGKGIADVFESLVGVLFHFLGEREDRYDILRAYVLDEWLYPETELTSAERDANDVKFKNYGSLTWSLSDLTLTLIEVYFDWIKDTLQAMQEVKKSGGNVLELLRKFYATLDFTLSYSDLAIENSIHNVGMSYINFNEMLAVPILGTGVSLEEASEKLATEVVSRSLKAVLSRATIDE